MSKRLVTLLLSVLLIAPACGSDTTSDNRDMGGQDASGGDTAEDATAPDTDDDAGNDDTSGEDVADEDTPAPDAIDAEADLTETDAQPDGDDPDARPDGTEQDVQPDVDEDVSADVVEDVTVDVVQDTTEDVTVDVDPDTTTDTNDDTAPDTAVDVAPDIEPDVPPVWCADTAWRQALPEPPFFDCSRAPGPVGPSRIVPNARGYHGIAFDSSGNIVGNDNTSLLRHKVDGTGGLWVPGVGTLQQMSFLEPGGDLVAGDFNGLLRVSPSGATTTLTPDLNIYGVEVGPDGMVYAAGNGGVWRINPATNSYETLLVGGVGFTPHSVTFNADYTLMIIGTLTGFSGGASDIIAYEVDCDLNPVGEQLVYAENVGGGYHDAVNFDICGNLYVCDFSNSDLYRVRAGEPVEGERFSLGGDVDLLIDWEIGGDALRSYGHGFVWGTGDDGWRPDAAYVPLPYASDQVKEVVIGIPGVRWNGRGLIE